MVASVFTKRNAGILAGIFALAMLSRFDSIISPSVAEIQSSFPHDDASTVESIATIGATAAVLSALLFGKLMEWMSFKLAGVISCSCIAFGGLMPLLFHSSVQQLLVFAIITGFGTGILTTVLPSLSAHFFKGPQLSGLMGKVLAMQDGSSMVLLAVGGLLATGGWIRNYWIYFLSLLGLLLVIVFVPNIRSRDLGEMNKQSDVSESALEAEFPNSNSSKQSNLAIGTCILLGFFSIFLVAILYNKLSVYMSEYHLGGTDAAGFALMFSTGSSVVIGLTINGIRSFLRNFTVPFAFMLMAVGAVMFLAFKSFPMVCLATFLIGSGSAIIMATCPFMLSNLSEQKHYPLVMGIFSAMTSLGFTVSTWVFKFVSDLTGMSPLQVSFYGMLILAVLIAFLVSISGFQSRVEKCYLIE